MIQKVWINIVFRSYSVICMRIRVFLIDSKECNDTRKYCKYHQTFSTIIHLEGRMTRTVQEGEEGTTRCIALTARQLTRVDSGSSFCRYHCVTPLFVLYPHRSFSRLSQIKWELNTNIPLLAGNILRYSNNSYKFGSNKRNIRKNNERKGLENVKIGIKY